MSPGACPNGICRALTIDCHTTDSFRDVFTTRCKGLLNSIREDSPGSENGEAMCKERASTHSEDLQRTQWLVAYTRPRHEQVVADSLHCRGLATLLPLYERFARWSDRIKRLRSPLFPGYVFVEVAAGELVKVLETAGVVSLVSRAGRPVPLSDTELQLVKACMQFIGSVEPHPYLTIGDRVRVTRGPFAGWEGILVDKKNSYRIVIVIEQLMRALAVNVCSADVQPLSARNGLSMPSLAL